MKTKLSMLLNLLAVMLFFGLKASAGSESLDRSTTAIPSHCIEKTFETPLALYREAYDASQVLGWGITNHRNFVGIKELSKFLDVVGSDENLRFIFIEYPAQAQAFFKNAVEAKEVTEEDLTREFYAYKFGINSDSELTMQVKFIYAKLFLLNKSRARPIELIPIESAWSKDGSYRFHPKAWDREAATAQNLAQQLSRLEPNQKAILLYHAYHLTRNVTGTLGTYDQYHNRLGSKTGPISFVGQSNIENFKYNLIVFDQYPPSSWNGYISYTFKSEQPQPPGLPQPHSSDFAAKLSQEEPSKCISDGETFLNIAEEIKFPRRLNEMFNYVVRLKE